MSVLSGSVHVLQPIFLSVVLHYDSLNIISLNYPELAGIVMGAILAYFILVRWNWGVKRYLFMTFYMVIYYVLSMYFICDTATDKETMYLAMFALGVSEVMIETIATYYLSQNIPFMHFFMNITIIGFVRCGIGSAAGAAVVHRLFNWSMAKSTMILSESFTDGADLGTAAEIVSSQGLMMAIKETYGYMIIIGVIMLLIILVSNYRESIRRFVPRLISVSIWMTHPKTDDPTIG